MNVTMKIQVFEAFRFEDGMTHPVIHRVTDGLCAGKPFIVTRGGQEQRLYPGQFVVVDNVSPAFATRYDKAEFEARFDLLYGEMPARSETLADNPLMWGDLNGARPRRARLQG